MLLCPHDLIYKCRNLVSVGYRLVQGEFCILITWQRIPNAQRRSQHLPYISVMALSHFVSFLILLLLVVAVVLILVVVLYWGKGLSRTVSCYVAQARLSISLSPPLEQWYYKHALPYQFFFGFVFGS